ncbi:sensor histidine kinase [Aquibaculum arenosum]|uniref:histidine kinase n=1 Tax=Aquibaculum arenosum TaxID=3032591 RepID=A0ABT5YIL6_9PROT|nr:HAMP domain-containing sensor histidine kinase [Fodinicurvata sp. CAU 1616]MDF2094783.1 HAMP domain-containing sensor histidine kinase [Fodinicurvata sp. CAU 1616]
MIARLRALLPQRRSILVAYGSLIPLILVSFGLLIFALTQTSSLERDMRISATENMLWVVSQTQMEVLLLANAAADLEGTSATTVEHRYDMAISRLNLLLQGPQQRYLQEIGRAGDVRSLHARLLEQDPLQKGTGPAARAALFQEAMALQPEINRLAGEVMTQEWSTAAARLDDYRRIQRTVILAVVGALLGTALMSWALMRNQRRLHAGELARLRASRLQSLLERERQTSAWYRDFAAMISHQVRTPLAVIDSAMQRLVRKGEGITATDVAERQTIVRNAVERVTRLVDTALLTGRLDNRQIEPQPAVQALGPLVEQTLDEARQAHPNRHIELSAANPEARAHCDPALVGHSLGNLLSNALKYSAEDTPVELRLFTQGNYVALAVADRGPGIPPAELERIFERFYRAENATSQPGSGLGLALARDLARLQGGDVTVESWPGSGSLFTLWLPRAGTSEIRSKR